jgi:ABC-2 type transport system ATP-binding protein
LENKGWKMSEDKAPSNSGIVATLRDVTVTYDSYLTRALSRVSLEIRRGEIMGILGAKGAGKSSVLKVLAGRVRPAEGTVKVFGRSPRGASKARIGYLPGKAEATRQPGFLRRLLGERKEPLSSVRGAARMSQVVLGNRDLLILDDPFAALEPAELIETKTFIREMAARGKTVVLSGDSLMEIKGLCDRMAILHEGKIQAAGTLAELLGGGGAIRFLPAMLPREIVERVLGVLREEILAPSPDKNSPSPSSEPPQGTVSAAQNTEQLLKPLAARVQNAPLTSTPPKKDDAIDHERLEELTKSKKSE